MDDVFVDIGSWFSVCKVSWTTMCLVSSSMMVTVRCCWKPFLLMIHKRCSHPPII